MDLARLYYDPSFPASYSGGQSFYREAIKIYPQLKKKDVTQFLKAQEAYTLHKKIRKPLKYRKTLIYGPRELWQIDLLDFQADARENRGFRYLCCIIDGFTKYLWVKPLKQKSGKAVVKALALLLMKERPKFIQADEGSEFFNKNVAKMLEAFGPKLYHTYSDKKASIVERVQRTLRGRLGRLYTRRGNRKWTDKIDQIVKSYNNTYHTSIKMKPGNVTEEHTAKIFATLYPPNIDLRRQVFKVGDTVRIVSERKRFQKEYEKGWTLEKFRIKAVKYTVPIVYLLEDLSGEPILGTFYANELQNVA